MTVDEFVTLLKFDVIGADKIQKIQVNLKKLTVTSKDVFKGIAGMVTSVAMFADKVSKDITTNYEWAKSIGVAADSYQKFDYAAKMVGGSLDDIKGDLQDWVRAAQASGQSLEEIFLQETKSIEGMSAAQSHVILAGRGYSETAIRMIQQGTEKLDEALSRVGLIPESELDAAQDYVNTWRQLQAEISLIGMQSVAKALPALREILEYIRQFLFENKESIKNFVINFFIAAANITKMIYRSLKPFLDVLGKLIIYFGNLKEGTEEGAEAINLLEKGIKILLGVLATAAIGTFIGWLGGLASAIWTVVSAVVGLTVALVANPIGAFILLIAAAAAAAYLLYKNWDQVVAAFKAFVNNPYDTLIDITNWFEKLADKVIAVYEGIEKLTGLSKWWNSLYGMAELSKLELNFVKKALNWIGGGDFSDKNGEFITPSSISSANIPATVSRENYYNDNRNITINTNATSGPALASYLKSNDLIRSGYGGVVGSW